MSKIIRINAKTYEKLNQIELESGSSKQIILEQAIEKLARELFMKKVNKAYEQLQKNPKLWKDELKERSEWESLNDNLEDF